MQKIKKDNKWYGFSKFDNILSQEVFEEMKRW